MRKEQLMALPGQFGAVDDVEEKRWIVRVIIFLLAGKIIHGGMRPKKRFIALHLLSAFIACLCIQSSCHLCEKSTRGNTRPRRRARVLSFALRHQQVCNATLCAKLSIPLLLRRHQLMLLTEQFLSCASLWKRDGPPFCPVQGNKARLPGALFPCGTFFIAYCSRCSGRWALPRT
jgi:hypothetical protein